MKAPATSPAWDMVLKNRGLARKFALTRRGEFGCLEREDLQQEALIGLHRAVATWRGERSKFSTYGWQWMRGTVGRAIKDTAHVVRVPVHAQESRSEERRRAAARALRVVSLDAPIPDTDLSPLDLLQADGEGAEARAERLEREQTAVRAVDALREPLRTIIRGRMGLDGPEPSLAELGRQLGMSRERVRQLQEEALIELRRALGSTFRTPRQEEVLRAAREQIAQGVPVGQVARALSVPRTTLLQWLRGGR